MWLIVSAKNGRTVLVSDIGEVTIGHRPRSGVVAFNQQDSVVEGIVQMTRGGNATKVIENLKQRIQLDRLFAVFNVEHDCLSHTRQLPEVSLGQATDLPV